MNHMETAFKILAILISSFLFFGLVAGLIAMAGRRRQSEEDAERELAADLKAFVARNAKNDELAKKLAERKNHDKK